MYGGSLFSGGSSTTVERPQFDYRSISGAAPVQRKVFREPSQYVPGFRCGLVSSTYLPASVSEDVKFDAPKCRKTDAELVKDLHDRSGLTWDLLAKTLGVSRRALHLWAGGATVTFSHRAVMERFERLLDSFGNIPATEIRARLFDRAAGGQAPIDRFRMTREGDKRTINGPALKAYEML